jgi:AraC-like DNA-binding protein
MMYTVAAECVRFLLSVARQHGQDPEEWMRARGYRASILELARVPLEMEQQLLEDMGERFPLFWKAAASTLQPGVLASIGFAAVASATLGDALDKIVGFSSLFNDGYRFTTTAADGGVEISTVRTAPGEVLIPHRAYFVLASLIQLARSVVRRGGERRLELASARFRHAAPTNLDELRRMFGDRIEFQQPRDSVTFHHHDLPRPNPAADANLAKILDESVCSQLNSVVTPTLPERVRSEIAVRLAFDVPAATEIAAQVGVSTRTMNRQLAEAGTSFSDLLQAIRLDRARAWLDAGESATVVASLVFYSEVAAFFRAYRRHFGSSPSAERTERPRVP